MAGAQESHILYLIIRGNSLHMSVTIQILYKILTKKNIVTKDNINFIVQQGSTHNRFITALNYSHLALMHNCKILCRFKCFQCVLTNCSVVLKDYDNG